MHEALKSQMDSGAVQSKGLIRLYEVLSEKLRENFCETFPEDWEKLTTGMERIGSMTLQFRLDEELHIQGASLEALNKGKYGKNSFLQRRKETLQEEKPWDMSALREMTTPAEELLEEELRFNQREFYQRMYRMTLDLDDLYQDLIFYLGALEYCARMAKASVTLCLPRILPVENKGFAARNMINPVLVVTNPSKTPVPNDVDFQKGGELFCSPGLIRAEKQHFCALWGPFNCCFSWVGRCRLRRLPSAWWIKS